MLGYSRAEILEKKIEDVSYRHAGVPRLFADYLQKKKQEGEFVLRHKNGMPVPIRYRAFVFADGCNAAIWEPIKDWRELYLSALVEIDNAKLKRRIDLALAAIQVREQELSSQAGGSGSERRDIRDAISALRILGREVGDTKAGGA